MNDIYEKTVDQAIAFQRFWNESFSKVMQAAMSVSPGSPPPEMWRELRGGVLEALSESWQHFMRSPQFLEGMSQWMEQATRYRKMNNDLMANLHSEMQSPSREDISSILLSVRHMEKRLLNRVDELSTQVEELSERLEQTAVHRAAPGRRRARKSNNGQHPAGLASKEL